jgi:hypothetical protein
MESIEQAFGRAGLLAAAMAALMLGGGCSSMPGFSDVKLMPRLNEVMPKPSVGTNEESAGLHRPVTPADLVDAQGVCAGGAGVVANEGEAAPQPARGVGLFMTECQVVQVLGVPQQTNISTTPRGEREVTMMFLTTDHAGIYRFVSGRLKSIERAPGAVEPEPAKKKPKRHSRKAGPA